MSYDCDGAVDELPPGDYQVREPNAGACQKCLDVAGGWRWVTLHPVHPNCECTVTDEILEPELVDSGTCVLSDQETDEEVSFVDRNGSHQEKVNWSTSRAWTVTLSVNGKGSIGVVEVGGSLGGSYGHTNSHGGEKIEIFNYFRSDDQTVPEDERGGNGQRIFARYEERVEQDVKVWRYRWSDVVNNSDDEWVTVKDGPSRTSRKFVRYVHRPVHQD